jgi:hypothetical protein
LSVTGAANVSRYDCGVAFRSSDVKRAIRELLRTEGLEIEPAALSAIVDRAEGYPNFLQEWGANAWNVAAGPPITLAMPSVRRLRRCAGWTRGFSGCASID